MKPSLLLMAASTGPVVIDVLGYDLPVLSVGTAVIGVILAYILAPRSARAASTGLSVALVSLFILILIAAEIAFKHTPLIALGWAIGLGYSGRVVLEEFGARVIERMRVLIEVLFPFLKKDPPK